MTDTESTPETETGTETFTMPTHNQIPAGVHMRSDDILRNIAIKSAYRAATDANGTPQAIRPTTYEYDNAGRIIAATQGPAATTPANIVTAASQSPRMQALHEKSQRIIEETAAMRNARLINGAADFL